MTIGINERKDQLIKKLKKVLRAQTDMMTNLKSQLVDKSNHDKDRKYLSAKVISTKKVNEVLSNTRVITGGKRAVTAGYIR